MSIDIARLAARAAAGGRQDREAAGDELVQLVREGGASANDAFAALCGAETDRIFHYFAVRVSDEQDAFDLSQDLLEKLRTAYHAGRLRLEHGARSFYAYIYQAAQRDAVRYHDKRRRVMAMGPGDLDTIDQWSRQPSVDELARSREMYDWLREATVDIRRDLDVVMLAYTQDLPRGELIATTGIPATRFDRVLNEAKNKVIDRFVCYYVARARGVARTGAETAGVCPGLVTHLSWKENGERHYWSPRHGFTTKVYMRVKTHFKDCAGCAEIYGDRKETGLRRDFLVLPLLIPPAHLADRLRGRRTAATAPTAVRPGRVRRGTPRTQISIAAGAAAVTVAAIVLALANPAHPDPSDQPVAAATSAPAVTPSPTIRPTPKDKDRNPPAPPPRRTSPPAVGATVPPRPPTASPTERRLPTAAPAAPLTISLATSAATCAPGNTCDPVPSCDTCSTTYTGDCGQGVALNFKTIIKVNRGPTKLTLRWLINGTPVNTEPVSFPGSGAQQTFVGQVTVLNTSSGPWTAQLEVLTPKSLKSNVAQATITCT